jgi:putative ABC transport system permease protein
VKALDLAAFAFTSLARQRFRSAMVLLSVAIGVAAVQMLISLGEGARGYVMDQFSFLGADTLVILPGRKTTSGGMPPLTGISARDITIQDVDILYRSVGGIASIAPLVIGTAPISHGGRERDALVFGTNRAFFDVRQLNIAQGESLPDLALDEGSPVAVIGGKLKQELFGQTRAIGRIIRLRDYRFRVIGVLEGRGDSFGMDLSDAVFVPVASAQSAFNVNGMFRVVLKLKPGADAGRVKRDLLIRMRELHDGEEDVTIISPDAMVSTFDGILRALTLGVSGIGAVSLVVAGILVMNLMLISVNQRTAEIGLLKALGAPRVQVRNIFLAEAGILACSGALCGAALGHAGVLLLQHIFPALPFHTPAWALLSSCALALLSALIFAWLPAMRAARLEPVTALGKR